MKKIILLSFIICLVSCKKDYEKTIIKGKEDKTIYFEINIDFPDTVYVGQYYNGKIDYKNVLDTITTKLLDVSKPRFLEYGFTVTKDPNYTKEFLKTIETDTFIAENHRMIPLHHMKFNKAGIRYIDGIITDEVNILGVGKNEKGEPMTRVITKEYRVTKKVVVIEKGNVSD